MQVFLHRFWEMLAYLANTLIFILVGVVITEQAVHALHDNDWFYILALYIGLTVIRLVSAPFWFMGVTFSWCLLSKCVSKFVQFFVQSALQAGFLILIKVPQAIFAFIRCPEVCLLAGMSNVWSALWYVEWVCWPVCRKVEWFLILSLVCMFHLITLYSASIII